MKYNQVALWTCALLFIVMDSIKGKFKYSFPFLIGLLFVLIVGYLISKCLLGYDLIAGGDFYSLYKPENHYFRYLYSWLDQLGRGWFNTLSPSFFYYYLDFLFEKTVLKSIFNFPIIFFFTFFYTSFYYFTKKIIPEINRIWLILLSIFYVFNYITLTIFTYSWGYGHHFIIYGFIPAIIWVLLTFLKSPKLEIKEILIAVIINAFVFVGYNNIAFFFVVLLVEVMFIFFYLIITPKLNFKIVLKNIIIFILIQVIIPIFYVSSFLLSNINNFEKASSTDVYDVHLWNESTSSSYVYSLISKPVIGNESLPIIYVYFLLPFILILFFYTGKKRYSEHLPLLLTVLFLILLYLKYNSPFGILFRNLFNYPFVSMLRSPDKIFIFFPFFYLLLLSEVVVKSKSKLFKFLLLILVTASCYYFVGNKITKYLIEKNKNYSYAVNIPDEYKDFAAKINVTGLSTSIYSLPYSVKNSINWSNYPKWHFVGHDVLHLLFNRDFISANVFDHPVYETNMTFRNLWKNPICCGDDYIEKSFDRFGVEYVIWHKDIDEGRFKENAPVYEMLQKSVKNGLIQKIEDNEYFEAYQVDESKIQPLISTEKGQVTFKKINPTKYIVDIKGLKLGDRLVFKQSFNPEWKIYTSIESIGSCDERYQYISRNSLECISYNDDFVFSDVSYIFKKPLSMEHEMVDEYANSWVFDERAISTLRNVGDVIVNEDGSVDVSLVIYFRSQSLLIIQYALLVFSIVVSSTSLILISRKKHKELII